MKNMPERIYLSPPHMGDLELKYVQDAFTTNWIAPVGPYIDEFELQLARKVKINSAAVVSSGTAALHLAMRLLNIGSGDYVFCSSFTFIATASPIVYQNAIPVFIDSEPDSWNMSPLALEEAFAYFQKQNIKPKAVVIVNIYGQSANYDSLKAICDNYNVSIIEDAAESLGAKFNGQDSGTIGMVGVFSFNGNKIITTSSGGALISNDRDLITQAKFLATQAKEKVPYYEHHELGYNYRMSNILAGIGLGQLACLQEKINARRQIFSNYVKALEKFDCIKWMPEMPQSISTRWLSCCYIDSDKISPAYIVEQMDSCNIETRRLWKPLHIQKVFKNYLFFSHSTIHGNNFSEYLFNRGFCLPSGSGLTQDQQNFVISKISKILEITLNKHKKGSSVC